MDRPPEAAITGAPGREAPAPPGPPAAATLLRPAGMIAASSPTYAWTAVPDANWYHLWVADPTGTPVMESWYTPPEVDCVGEAGTCTVTPASLAPGTYAWRVETRYPGGEPVWSKEEVFTLRP